MIKICSICKNEKDTTCFGNSKRTKDGFRGECKECRKKIYYGNHSQMLEQKRKDYRKHKSERLLKCKEYYQKNREITILKRNKYYHSNKEKISYKRSIYRLKNKDKIRQKKHDDFAKKMELKRKIKEEYIKNLITVEYPKDKYKICTTCQTLKHKDDFFNDPRCNLGKSSICKVCSYNRNKNYVENNREKIKENYKKYRKNNLEKIKAKNKRYANSESGIRYKNSIQVRIANRLRSSLKKAVKLYDANKIQPTLKYLGCEMWYFIAYLRAGLTDKMNNSMLINGFLAIDHEIPLCSLDLTEEENLKKVCHYTNLRPFFSVDNSIKSTEDKKLSIR